MVIKDVELTKQTLANLNKRIGEMEQKQGEEEHLFFNAHLSDQLIFRRASGKIVAKSEPEGFLDSLKNWYKYKMSTSREALARVQNRRLRSLKSWASYARRHI